MMGTYLSGPLNVQPAACLVAAIFITSCIWQHLVSWGHSCWFNMHAHTSVYRHTHVARSTNVHPSTTFTLFIKLWGVLTFAERPDKSLWRGEKGKKKMVKKKSTSLHPTNATRKCQINRFTGNNRRVQSKITKCHSLGPPLPCTEDSSSPAY